MHVVLAGPVQVAPLAPLLRDVEQDERALPRADGGVPVTRLARGLVNHGGIKVSVVALAPGMDRPQRYGGSGVDVIVGPERSHGRGRDVFRAERSWISETVRELDADVVHAHWTYEYALGALAAGRPTVVTVHDWAPRIMRLLPDAHRAVRLGMNVGTLVRARHLTAPSPYLAARLGRWLRRPVPVIPNGLPDDVFSTEGDASGREARLLLAVNQGFGRMKNVTTLLRAYARVRALRPDARLQLAGTGYEPRGAAAQWARAEQLDAGVEFLGPVPSESVPALMRQADVFVHPSLEESFGLVLVEAMAQRRPVIGGRRSGAVPWVLDHGRAGVLTDVTSPPRLAAAIASLLEDGGLRRTFADAGFRRAQAAFGLTSVVDQYLDAYARAREDGAG